jgi:hypothetical protein
MSEPTINPRKPHLWWNRAWTLIEGCTKCSEGCADCWALAMEARTFRAVEGGGIRLRPDRLDEPLHWKKPRVVAVWNDLYHEDAPQGFIARAEARMVEARRHTFLTLTKRPHQLRGGPIAPNIWRGVTCESNAHLWRVEELIATPAAVRWVNAHLFGPLDLAPYLPEENPGPEPYESEVEMFDRIARDDASKVSWLAIECNRPFRGDPAEWWGWCESLVEQASAAGVPVWVKQGPRANGSVTHDLAAFPPWARRREFPQQEGESHGRL